MSWDNIRLYDDRALSYCKENDWNSFMDWVEQKGIDKCMRPASREEDIPKLLRTGVQRAYYPNNVPNPGFYLSNVFDHCRVYKNTRTGQCWLVSHTYDDTYENINMLKQWCDKEGLTLSFLEKSWYYPGHALGVVITINKEECENE